MTPAGCEPAEMPNDAIEVGKIADAWGIKGWFKVWSYSSQPEALFSSKRWFLLPPENTQRPAGKPLAAQAAWTGCVKLSIKEAKEHSDAVVACAQAVDDRNAAEALRGARIFIARSSFPSTAEDEFYWVDLIGLEAINRQEESLGTVRELLSTGPQTVLVLEQQVDGKTVERMVPFVAAYIDKVDVVARLIRVDWQMDY